MGNRQSAGKLLRETMPFAYLSQLQHEIHEVVRLMELIIFFVSKEEFKKRITAGEFLEYAEFNGNLYGTEKKNIELAANKNADLLLDIEVQGVEQVKKIYGSNVSCIFVFPPSFAELEKRLRSRGN